MKLTSIFFSSLTVFLLALGQGYAKHNPDHPSGICFFDIDDTLTQNHDTNEKVINACLDKNFAVGIITASTRSFEKVCGSDGHSPRYDWISEDFCSILNHDGHRMYNSHDLLAGGHEQTLKDQDLHDGYRKAYQARYTRDHYYSHLPERCVILFDNDPGIVKHYKKYNEGQRHSGGSYSCNVPS